MNETKNEPNFRKRRYDLSFSITNAGGVYRVQTHTHVANPSGWITISTNTAPFTFTDTNVLGGSPQRFYRVVTP